MNNRTQIRIFTIIGILLILCSVLYIFVSIQNINRAVENNFDEWLKSEEFKVNTFYGFKGYKVYITLGESILTALPSRCGYLATDFLITFKEKYPDIDVQIRDYNFNFLEYISSRYGDSLGYYTTSYKTKYINNKKDISIYELEITLTDATGIKYEAKTYLQYLDEWSTRYYDSEHYPFNRIPVNGERYTIYINDDRSYEIRPNSTKDLERNLDSTLEWYMDEYASPYFTLTNMKMDTTNTGDSNTVHISFSYTNNTQWQPEDAELVFYIYNESDEVIGIMTASVTSVEQNMSKDIVVYKSFKDKQPAYFRVAYVNLRGFEIVFE